jgi:predicted  nucleic acid-binding Zn-ribbon protein
MEKNNRDLEEKTKGTEEETISSIAKIEDMNLDETQLAEQLYYSAGLDPIIEAGMKDYEKHIQQENKLINKVFGIRESDIKGYSEAVSKRVAFAVYSLLNKQYGGKVGNMRSYILNLEDERNRANTRYDELMGRVIGILGDEYKELRTDSKEFMEKLTKTLGEDLKASKIDQTALAARLADIDGLRAQINNLQNENQQIIEKYESQINDLRSDHKEEVRELKSQISVLESEHKEEIGKLDTEITKLNSEIEGLKSEIESLTTNLEKLTNDYDDLKNAIKTTAMNITEEKIGANLSDSLYKYLLDDSKVPHMVIDGVGKFINFRKYLGEGVERGVKEACGRFVKLLENKN